MNPKTFTHQMVLVSAFATRRMIFSWLMAPALLVAFQTVLTAIVPIHVVYVTNPKITFLTKLLYNVISVLSLSVRHVEVCICVMYVKRDTTGTILLDFA